METLQRIRIFIASPGDVADERGIALKLIDDLGYDPAVHDRAVLEPVSWDQPGGGAPILASMTPQASISAGLPKPSECDIVVVVLWARIGTPLPAPEYAKPDGSPYLSGTDWEFHDAVSAARAHGGRPAVLLYRRTDAVLLDPDADDFDERVRQRRLVHAFFDGLRDPATGAILQGHRAYAQPEEFRSALESDLRVLVHRALTGAAPTPGEARATARRWEGSPFPGLRSFTVADAPIFFGRGRETDQLVRRVTASRLVAVVGASGSGKSSLVGAGLIPRLAAGAAPEVAVWLLPSFDRTTMQWSGLRFTPAELGDDPFVALAAHLAPLVDEVPHDLARELADDPASIAAQLARAVAGREPATEALMVADQFEELFSNVDPRHVPGFVTLLATAAAGPHARVVLTLRSDFYARALDVPALARLLERNAQLPLPATTDTLLEMITGPAARAGLAFDEGLPERIVGDTGREPGALPLLAYTLDELHRTCAATGRLTRAAYDALGGVRGAIGTRAEDVFEHRLTPEMRAAFAPVFRELVEIDDRGAVARRAAPRAVVTRTRDQASLVDRLTEARLLVQSGGRDDEAVVSVAHEALFRGWGRLDRWIEERRDDLRLLRKVRVEAEEWERHGRDSAYLWQHERLAPVHEMLARLDVPLDPVTAAFVRPEFDRIIEQLEAPGIESYRRRSLADRLVAIGPPAISALLRPLGAPNPAVREAARGALARIGLPALPALRDVLGHPSPEARLAAVTAIRDIGDRSAVPLLAAAVRDEDARVRGAAVGTLRAIQGPGAVEALGAALTDADVDVRWRAAAALGTFGAAGVPALLDAWNDPGADLRDQARQALLVVGDEAVEPLDEALRSPAPATRDAAAQALLALRGAGIDALARALGDADADVRWRVAEVLTGVRDRHAAAVEALANALEDQSAGVRQSAAAALAAMADPASVPALIQALGDGEPDVRDAAAEALGAIGHPAVGALVATLGDARGPAVHAAAANGLGRIGAPAVDAVRTLGEDRSSLRQRAVAILAGCGRPGVPALLALLEQDPGEPTILCSLRALGDAAVPDAVHAVGSASDAGARRAAASALVAIGTPPALTAAGRVLADADDACGELAAIALARSGDGGVRSLFRVLLGDEPVLRARAALGLRAAGAQAVSGLLDVVDRGGDPAATDAAGILRAIATPMSLFGLAERGLH